MIWPDRRLFNTQTHQNNSRACRPPSGEHSNPRTNGCRNSASIEKRLSFNHTQPEQPRAEQQQGVGNRNGVAADKFRIKAGVCPLQMGC